MANDGDEWHRQTAKRVGEAVATQRKALGMTAQQLAQRCKELGVPIHRTTVTKIENGRTRFDLGELLVLAAALDTAPVVLLYPDPYDTNVEVLPGEETSNFLAAQWVSGHAYWKISADAGLASGRLIYNARKLNDRRDLERFEVQRALLVAQGDEVDRKQISYLDDLIIRYREQLRVENSE